MPTEPSLSFRHVPQLDGVRAIAVLIVIISHAGLGQIIPGGFGVTIFFFLSGYLITSLLRVEIAERGGVDFKAFYLRRTLRIMPALYVTLAILTALYLAGTFGDRVNPSALPWDYLFLSNYSHLWGQTRGLPVPLWSLAIEEHFYLLFPLAFAIYTAHGDFRRTALACAAACVIILGLRFTTLLWFDGIGFNYYWSHTRMDSILFGCILALWQNPLLDRNAWQPRRSHVAAALILVLCTFAFRDELFRQTIRYTLHGVGLFVLFSYVLAEGSKVLQKVLTSPPMIWIGLVSYSLYLCHFAIFQALTINTELNAVAVGVTGTLLSLGYAFLMRRYVELPILNWRRKRSAAKRDKLARIAGKSARDELAQATSTPST